MFVDRLAISITRKILAKIQMTKSAVVMTFRLLLFGETGTEFKMINRLKRSILVCYFPCVFL